MKKDVFFLMLVIMILFSCNKRKESSGEVQQYPFINLASSDSGLYNLVRKIRAISDSELVLFTSPSWEIRIYNTNSGKLLARLGEEEVDIDALMKKYVLPEMNDKLLISRDSFVSFTSYDPGSIEFNEISITNDTTYLSFNLPLYYIDTVEKQYRYYPAVFVGVLDDLHITNIRYLSTNAIPEKGVKFDDWPFTEFGFKVLGKQIVAFNLSDTSDYGEAEVPLLMTFGNCREKRCIPVPDHYPRIYLNKNRESKLPSNVASGRTFFNKQGSRATLWWDGHFYNLPEGKEIYPWLKEKIAPLIYSFDFTASDQRYLLMIAPLPRQGDETSQTSILLFDMKNKREILNRKLTDDRQSLESSSVDVFGEHVYYLDKEYDLYHFRVE